jgi:hypothetical protein
MGIGFSTLKDINFSNPDNLLFLFIVLIILGFIILVLVFLIVKILKMVKRVLIRLFHVEIKKTNISKEENSAQTSQVQRGQETDVVPKQKFSGGLFTSNFGTSNKKVEEEDKKSVKFQREKSSKDIEEGLSGLKGDKGPAEGTVQASMPSRTGEKEEDNFEAIKIPTPRPRVSVAGFAGGTNSGENKSEENGKNPAKVMVGGTPKIVVGGTAKVMVGGTPKVVVGGTPKVVAGGTPKVVVGDTVKATAEESVKSQREKSSKDIAAGLSKLKTDKAPGEDTVQSKMPSRAGQPAGAVYNKIEIPRASNPQRQGLVSENDKTGNINMGLRGAGNGLVQKSDSKGGGTNSTENIFKMPTAGKGASSQRAEQDSSIFGGESEIPKIKLEHEMKVDTKIWKAAKQEGLTLSPVERANLVKEVFSPVFGRNISKTDLKWSIKKLGQKMSGTKDLQEHAKIRKEIKFFKKIGGIK